MVCFLFWVFFCYNLHRLSWEQGVGFSTVMLAVNLIFNDGET